MWVREYVVDAEGRKATEGKTVVVDLGDRIGVIRPIATAGICVQCHGERASLDPATLAAIEKRYPRDQAVGFREGDLRGYFWAEAFK